MPLILKHVHFCKIVWKAIFQRKTATFFVNTFSNHLFISHNLTKISNCYSNFSTKISKKMQSKHDLRTSWFLETLPPMQNNEQLLVFPLLFLSFEFICHFHMDSFIHSSSYASSKIKILMDFLISKMFVLNGLQVNT